MIYLEGNEKKGNETYISCDAKNGFIFLGVFIIFFQLFYFALSLTLAIPEERIGHGHVREET